MAKRPKLRMTNADYVAIAVSPALIMALVGSLVFFLIEVLYVGQYQARLMYVFAWFVFAAVLIGRIAIEMGSERAAMFALPLGVAMFLVLAKFVEHASPYSHLINITLLALVWWSAHKLTWDCTLIDDSEDASGEGLMQRVGADELATPDEADSPKIENELLGEPTQKKKTPHAPGLWVLYFSLAALPLFGIGQKWIPASDVGRRQYAFGLLAVYVAAGLTLLVTTSFLGLRRYLRQRRVEMPTPMAATWVVTGVALIGIVMLLAALIPRPSAEYAISQVPWQVRSSDDLASSRTSMGNDGTEDDSADQSSRKVLNKETDPNSTAQREGENPTSSSEQGEKQTSGAEGQESEGQQTGGEQSQGQDSGESKSQSSERGESSASKAPSESSEGGSESESESGGGREPSDQAGEGSETNPEESQAGKPEMISPDQMHSESPAQSPSPPPPTPDLLPSLSGLTGVLKLLLYLALTLVVLYLAWRHREQIAQAIADILRMIREFFGGKRTHQSSDTHPETEKIAPVSIRPFASYSNPFASGQYRTNPPSEVVRYTFEAFEAWSRERSHPRSPDQTPMELVRQAIPADSPMQAEAQRLARLYNEAAFAPHAVTVEAVEKLATLWKLMSQAHQVPVESIS